MCVSVCVRSAGLQLRCFWAHCRLTSWNPTANLINGLISVYLIVSPPLASKQTYTNICLSSSVSFFFLFYCPYLCVSLPDLTLFLFVSLSYLSDHSLSLLVASHHSEKARYLFILYYLFWEFMLEMVSTWKWESISHRSLRLDLSCFCCWPLISTTGYYVCTCGRHFHFHHSEK